ncbi:type II secretion system protein XpsH [Marilutibacter chinensis]|uniref:Type II secretion system protein H n=1 Tax=Marilutibacter chinensis TaxID=2912247 RepID=A0ABS9HUB7_9GAMM|nr:GspH/FimT family pseudopilin [Lysobacter chinensis]MCF7222101.1 GspH/FimT family pseudopilin [Lysobacter chinensis]
MSARASSRRVRGVSLVEMLLVVALFAVASLLAAAAMTGGFRGMQLRSAAKEVASQLRYTRAQALATGEPQRFVIDPQAHRWEAPNGRHGEIPEAVGIRFTGAREAQAAEGQGAVLFFRDGAATGGRIQLSIEQAAWNIDVAWLTGEVRLRRAEAER